MTMCELVNALQRMHHVVVRTDGPRTIRTDLPGSPVVIVYPPLADARRGGSTGTVIRTGKPVVLDGRTVDAVRMIFPANRAGLSARVLTILYGRMEDLSVEDERPVLDDGPRTSELDGLD